MGTGIKYIATLSWAYLITTVTVIQVPNTVYGKRKRMPGAELRALMIYLKVWFPYRIDYVLEVLKGYHGT